MENIIEENIKQAVKESWNSQKEKLMRELNVVTCQLDDILKLDIYRREGHKSATLKKSIGSFGSSTVNTANLEALLDKSQQSTGLSEERLARISELKSDLEQVRKNNDFSFLFFKFDNNCQEIVDKAEAHLNAQAQIFRALRISRMEAKAKYQANLHDCFFENFSWSHLDDDELKLCAPVILLLDMDKSFDQQFTELMPLLSSGLPIKMFVTQDRLTARSLPNSSRAAVASSSLNIELLPMALQKVFVFQSVFGTKHFEDSMLRGIQSQSPGFFSILCANEESIESAVASRVFPYFVYDPSSSSDFVTRLDLSGNPQLESLWFTKELKYKAADGQEQTMSVELTLADYLLGDPVNKDEFTLLNQNGKGTESLVPLAKYLRLSAGERAGQVPVVYSVTADKALEMYVPSRDIILQSSEKMDSWHALREMTGIDNPLIQKNQKTVEERFKAEKEQALAQLRAEMEAKIQEREKQVVADAMKNLSMRLLGLNSAADMGQVIASAAAAPAAKAETDIPVKTVTAEPEPAAEEVSETVWVETNLCTSCDECIDLNGSIFAYNDQKLAIIKDPKGGPFKDIVKAAEMCPSHIIHPGTPQDPDEKNLDKLIERAEPYQ